MPPKAVGPDLTKYMDKELALKLNANRKVTGRLRGFDQFMNIVLENTHDVSNGADSERNLGTVVIRGNSIVMIEAMQPIQRTNYAPKTR